MHRLIAIICLLTIVAREVAADPVRIGVSLPLTGESAGAGIDARNALEFAARHFGKGKAELWFEDDQCTGKGAVSAANKLVSLSKVSVVLGPICSGALLAAGPIYERAGILTFGIATSSPAISGMGPHIFRVAPNDVVSAKLLASHMNASGLAVGVLSEQTEFCESFRHVLRSTLEAAGKTVVDLTFLPGEADLRSLLLRLKAAKVEGLFINTQNERTFLNVVEQVERLGWKPRIYAAYWPSSGTVLSMLGGRAEGIEFVDLKAPEQFLSPEGLDIYRTFKKEYGEPKSNPVVPPLAMEAFRCAISSLETPDAIGFIRSTTFRGIFGSYTFDRDGDISTAPLGMYKIKSGRVEPIESPT
jgi:branched-chain amino acid transport system substrate-binding protein